MSQLFRDAADAATESDTALYSQGALQHWMRLACCRTLAAAHQAAQGLVQAHGSKPGGQASPVQVLALYSCLCPVYIALVYSM